MQQFRYFDHTYKILLHFFGIHYMFDCHVIKLRKNKAMYKKCTHLDWSVVELNTSFPAHLLSNKIVSLETNTNGNTTCPIFVLINTNAPTILNTLFESSEKD